MNNKLITVIGSGPLSLGLAAQYAQAGRQVFYVDLTDNQKLREEKKIRISGIWNDDIRLFGVSFDVNDIPACDEITIAITPSHFKVIFPIVLKKLSKGMQINFFPASFGAMIFCAMLKNIGLKTDDYIITESVSYPYVCTMKSETELLAQSKKNELRVAVEPAEKKENTINKINEVFSIFTSAKNFLETSLDNMNMSLHPLPVLMNVASLDSEKPFRHYMDGVTPSIGNLMDKLDAERMNIGKALNIDLSSALDQLKKYYGDNESTNIFEYVSDEKGPYTKVGRFDLNSRYVQEDIPYLLVPAIAIADDLGIEVPTMKLCVNLANSILGVNFQEIGFNKKTIGL